MTPHRFVARVMSCLRRRALSMRRTSSATKSRLVAMRRRRRVTCRRVAQDPKSLSTVQPMGASAEYEGRLDMARAGNGSDFRVDQCLPPALRGRGCSPASMPCSHSGVATAAARCASSPSSPMPQPSETVSPTGVSPRHRLGSRPPAAGPLAGNRCPLGRSATSARISRLPANTNG